LQRNIAGATTQELIDEFGAEGRRYVRNHYVVPEVFWFKGASSSMAKPRRPIPAEFRRGNDLRLSKERGRNWKNVRRKKLFCPACELLGVYREGRRHVWAKGYCTSCAKTKGFIEPERSRTSSRSRTRTKQNLVPGPSHARCLEWVGGFHQRLCSSWIMYKFG
jgi:hypothetical protein